LEEEFDALFARPAEVGFDVRRVRFFEAVEDPNYFFHWSYFTA